MTSRIQLGMTRQQHPLYWNNTSNSHLAVYGTSGMGKSYFLRKLLRQLPSQGICAIVFDTAGDFACSQSNDTLPNDSAQVLTRVDVRDISLNLFSGAAPEEAADTACRLAGLLQETLRLHRSQAYKLEDALCSYWETSPETPSLHDFWTYAKSTPHLRQNLASSLSAIGSLSRLLRENTSYCSLDLNTPGITILDLTEISGQTLRQAVVEMIMNSIWQKRLKAHDQYCPLVLIFDECQNYRFSENSTLVRLLREGRKYQIAGWFSTQWLNKPDAASALGQAALQAHFPPDLKHLRTVARTFCPDNAAKRKQYETVLSSLPRGQFLYQLPDGRPIISCVAP